MRFAPLLIAALLLTGTSHAAPLGQTAEVRGDFHYDAAGGLLGVRHADFPEGFVRRPMSHREKYEILGIRLPDRPEALLPRYVEPKAVSVLRYDGQLLHRVMVKFVDRAPVRLRGGALTAAADLAAVDAVLARYADAEIVRAFSVEERILEDDRDTGQLIGGRELPDLNNWYLVRFPEGSVRGPDLANDLLALDLVETAYLDVKAEPAQCADIPPTTPAFRSGQFYLDPAPDGVDAEFAWAYHPGGNGAGPDFWVIDCEWGWCFGHEDLPITSSDVVNGSSGASSTDHGTAVIGEFGSCDNDYGVTGISYDVAPKMSDFDSEPTWAANIVTAGSVAAAGEIVLLEIHVPGPDSGQNCVCNCGQFEYVPVEWGQASYDAVETATANGVLMVEAGGNGSMDLDGGQYLGRFDRMVRDSGAIMVGAGQPGSHSPECWTNSGRRIDVHGFGSSVHTSGYADLWNQSGCTQDYTDSFGGTSSASPIIVGVCASVQGVANEKYGFDLSPRAMRSLIQTGGTPQGPPTWRIIRSLPDLASVLLAMEDAVDAPAVAEAPGRFALGAPRPNPFGTATAISFEIPAGGGEASLGVFDVRGRRIVELANGSRAVGRYTVTWDGRDAAGERVASGVYFVRMETEAGQETRKITLLN